MLKYVNIIHSMSTPDIQKFHPTRPVLHFLRYQLRWKNSFDSAGFELRSSEYELSRATKSPFMLI